MSESPITSQQDEFDFSFSKTQRKPRPHLDPLSWKEAVDLITSGIVVHTWSGLSLTMFVKIGNVWYIGGIDVFDVPIYLAEDGKLRYAKTQMDW